jgi:hypothetical protein
MDGATENPGLMNYKFLLAVIHKSFGWNNRRVSDRSWSTMSVLVLKDNKSTTTWSQAGQWEGRNSNPFPSEQKATVVIKVRMLMP